MKSLFNLITACLAVAVCALAAPVRAGVTIDLSADADTFVSNGTVNGADQSGKNYGGAGAMMVASADLGKGDQQSLIRFDTAGVKSAFDTQFGAGQWHVTSISLRNGGNFGTAGTQPNNPVFAAVTKGNFDIAWMKNDSWVEGAGNPNNNDTTPGVLTYNNLGNYISGDDQNLGTFYWDAPGNNIPETWNLSLGSRLIADVIAGDVGNETSFRYSATPGGSVGFLFNQRTFGAPDAPVLAITADVPEPASISILAIGMLALGLRRRQIIQ